MKIREEMYGNGWPFEVGTMWDLLRNNVQCRSEANCMSPMWPLVLSSLYNNSAERIPLERPFLVEKQAVPHLQAPCKEIAYSKIVLFKFVY